MFFQFVVILAILSVAFSSVSTPSSKCVSASLKENDVQGLGGLDLKCAFPFKIDDYTVGFRHSFGGDMNRGPEALFVKREFDINDGHMNVEAQYESADNMVSVAAKWVSDKLKLAVGLEGNTKDKLTNVELTSNEEVQGSKVRTTLGYDLANQKISGKSAITKDDTTVQVAYDTEDADPVLTISHKLDENNAVQPSLSLKDGKMKYGWLRKWEGGSLETTLYPGDKVTLQWDDDSSSGVWKTKATVPMNDIKGSKVSVSRDWKV